MYFTNKYNTILGSKGIMPYEWERINIHKRYDIWMNLLENRIQERLNKIQNIGQRTRFIRKVDLIKKVYLRLKDHSDWTIKQALVSVATSSAPNSLKKVGLKRTQFFTMQSIIFTTLVMNVSLNRKEERCFNKIMPKLTTPKVPHNKYSVYLKMCIAQYYDEQMERTGINVSDLVDKLRKGDIILINGREDLSKISTPTVTKCIQHFSRHYQKHNKKDNYVFKLKPYQMIKLGRVQLDVKYLTPKFTGLSRTIYWIDMKDEASKVIYAEVSTNQTASSINRMIINGINYFKEKFGIRIIRIQTDHCNSFKEAKIANDFGFQQILKTFHIQHRYCIFRRPQTNGTIERHHSTVKKELRVAIRIAAKGGLEDIQRLCQGYVERFNFNRYHSYTYRIQSFVKLERDIPFKRLQSLKLLETNKEVILD